MILDGVTMKEIGTQEKCTESRISQVLKSAREKIKKFDLMETAVGAINRKLKNEEARKWLISNFLRPGM